MRNLEDMKKSDNIMSSDAKEGTENIPDIDKVISELVNYASENELIEANDKIFIVNRLLDIFEKNGLAEDSEIIKNSGVQELNNTRPIADILSDFISGSHHKNATFIIIIQSLRQTISMNLIKHAII